MFLMGQNPYGLPSGYQQSYRKVSFGNYLKALLMNSHYLRRPSNKDK